MLCIKWLLSWPGHLTLLGKGSGDGSVMSLWRFRAVGVLGLFVARKGAVAARNRDGSSTVLIQLGVARSMTMGPSYSVTTPQLLAFRTGRS